MVLHQLLSHTPPSSIRGSAPSPYPCSLPLTHCLTRDLSPHHSLQQLLCPDSGSATVEDVHHAPGTGCKHTHTPLRCTAGTRPTTLPSLPSPPKLVLINMLGKRKRALSQAAQVSPELEQLGLEVCDIITSFPSCICQSRAPQQRKPEDPNLRLPLTLPRSPLPPGT